MKNLIFATILILNVGVLASAQTKNEGCPKITVFGPSSIPTIGEPISFTAVLGEGVEKYDVKYKWTVSNSEIIEGQGTTTIKVKMDSDSLTATVVISGLPAKCNNKASESLIIDFVPNAQKFYEFTENSLINQTQLEKMWAKYVKELQSEPNSQGYIYRCGLSEKTLQNEMKLRNYLVKKLSDSRHITFVIDKVSNSNKIELWIVPAGADIPVSEVCINADINLN